MVTEFVETKQEQLRREAEEAVQAGPGDDPVGCDCGRAEAHDHDDGQEAAKSPE